MSDAVPPAEPSLPASEEPPMEIHKPKPVHNWREFLIELGTIVLGICIAISLEQFVEYLHWHHEVQVGRQALMEEIAVIDRFYARRVLIAPCLDRRLAADAAGIRDIGASRKLTPQAASPASASSGLDQTKTAPGGAASAF
jgi:hypothetical protein